MRRYFLFVLLLGTTVVILSVPPDVPLRKKSPLQHRLDQFDFTEYEQSLNTFGRLPTRLLERYQAVLLDHINPEPPAPITNAVPPWGPVDCTSEEYSAFLTGNSSKGKLVYDFIPFAYEVDVLEMRLYELNASVDKFIIAESTYTHRLARKPLFFSRHWGRFEPFRDKIIYLVLDDAFVQSQVKSHDRNHVDGDDWRIEDVIRRELWFRYVAAYGLPADDSLVIHGDIDEIPHGKLVQHIQQCELKISVLNFPLTFFRFNLGWVEPGRTSKPVLSIRTVKEARFRTLGRLPEPRHWQLNECGRWGFDLNRFGPIQMQLYKDLSVAEGGQIPRGDLGMLRDMDYAYHQSVARGERLCCAHPQHASVDAQCGRLKPFIAVQNPERYRAFLMTQ